MKIFRLVLLLACLPCFAADGKKPAWDGALPEFMLETVKAEKIHDEKIQRMYVAALQHITASDIVARMTLDAGSTSYTGPTEINSCFIYPFTTPSGINHHAGGAAALSLKGTLPSFNLPGIQPTRVIFFEKPDNDKTLTAEVVIFDEKLEKSTSYRAWFNSVILRFHFSPRGFGSYTTLTGVDYTEIFYN